jgi:Ca-activated chloride channel family protein
MRVPRILWKLVAFATSLASVILLPPRLRPSQSPIQISSNLVYLPVTVTDRNGNLVTRLTRDDFSVAENGQTDTVTYFGDQNLPVTVGLLVDHSGSMGSKLMEVATAADAFADSSNPQDQLFVVNFNEVVSLKLPGGVPFTSDRVALRAAVSASMAEGETALYDAIISALNHLALSPEKRAALIVVTDGGDNASHHSFQQAFELAEKSAAQIYCIGIYDSNDPDAKPGLLRKLAKATGGTAYFPLNSLQVTEDMKTIAGELREEYVLGFVPGERKQKPGWRAIHVAVSRRDGDKLAVRTRPGYTYVAGANIPNDGRP